MYHEGTVKSNAKRLLIVPIVIGFLLIAVGVYIYPRRVVPTLFSLFPSENMVACLRVHDFDGLWRGFSETAFSRRVREGAIFPIREMLDSNEKFSEEWEDIDTFFITEVFGRDCIIATYLQEEGKPMRVAAWSRIGFRTRLFYLWERVRSIFSSRRRKELMVRRVGCLRVTTVLDRKTRAPRFSYVLLGDLGIASLGYSEGFWKAVGDLAGKGGRTTLPEESILTKCAKPGDACATGAFIIDIERLRGFLDNRIDLLVRTTWRDWKQVGEQWARAGCVMEKWSRLEGNFSLGAKTRIEIDMERRGGAAATTGNAGSERDASSDPLAGMLDNGGIIYVGSHCDLHGLFENLRAAGERRGSRVEFARRKGTDVFPANHFSLSWLGDDFSILIYRGAWGMVDAAVSFQVKDRNLAAGRLKRFLSLADGARVRLVDGKGKKLVTTEKRCFIKMGRLGDMPYCLIRPGGLLSRFYAPAIALHGDRMIITTSESLLPRLVDEKHRPPGAWAEPASAQIVLRGAEAERAAASVRQIIGIASIFVEKPSERRRLAVAGYLLGLVEWLAPLKEMTARVTGEEEKVHISVKAEFEDLSKPGSSE